MRDHVEGTLDSSMLLRRVAIYGGTFDPVHNGHLEVARRVLELFELDEVIFVPACVPPHKRNAKITSPFHRFAMLALATEADQRLLVSTIELDAPEQPYAVETVERMRNALGKETELFFLMGADSWLEIRSWHQWKRLLSMCNFIIVTRPGIQFESAFHVDMPINVTNNFGRGCRQLTNASSHNETPHAYLTDVVQSEVSATRIRAAVQSHDMAALQTMVPIAVANYIEKYGLYKN
ncbi:MAG: nicotinate (nicotinamide) nucleotide adenylyltransferase [Acidobacteria bacterium]|nr:MAG: nicotinate (nicotinamide) nucleotide adenylyltransferase [Acidobacteriota bacterium]